MTVLELRDISKTFKGHAVIDGISLSVDKGETVVLFGASGAGKSVLLRLVAGVIDPDPDRGQVFIDGRDMADVGIEERGIGMAFQNFALFPHMDAFENIAAPLEARHTPANAIRDGVTRVAKLLLIDHVLTHRPKALSNGQKQRTALARALVSSPPLLLLDDPLRNVDAKLRFEMRLELPRLLAEQGATVIYVTQDYKEAMALGDRIAVMGEGRIRQIGTPEEIYDAPAGVEIARLFGDPTINLLPVTPEKSNEGASVQIAGTRIALPPPVEEEIAGRHCLLGLRPEALGFARGADEVAIPVTIEAETPLNEKIVSLTTTAEGLEILVSRPSDAPGGIEGGDSGPAHVTVDPRKALLFDAETGKRIALRPAAANGAAAGPH